MLPLRDHLPTRSVPVVNYVLIALNVGVFGLEVSTGAGVGGAASLERWALVPDQLLANPAAHVPCPRGAQVGHPAAPDRFDDDGMQGMCGLQSAPPADCTAN